MYVAMYMCTPVAIYIAYNTYVLLYTHAHIHIYVKVNTLQFKTLTNKSHHILYLATQLCTYKLQTQN